MEDIFASYRQKRANLSNDAACTYVQTAQLLPQRNEPQIHYKLVHPALKQDMKSARWSIEYSHRLFGSSLQSPLPDLR